MKEQQLIERREIAIEMKAEGVELKDFAVYVRLWDQLAWKLSPKFEFVVSKGTTMAQLAEQVQAFLTENHP